MSSSTLTALAQWAGIAMPTLYAGILISHPPPSPLPFISS
jgi:hypothetical protein